MSNIVSIICSEFVSSNFETVMNKLKNNGYSYSFNGEDFDFYDSNGACMTEESGVSFHDLKAIAESEVKLCRGDKVKVTLNHTKNDNDMEKYNFFKDLVGKEVIVDHIYCSGNDVIVLVNVLSKTNKEDYYYCTSINVLDLDI